MKKFLSLTVLSVAIALFAFVQFGCSPQPNNNLANANMATPAATPDRAAIERELLRIENDFPRVLKEHDAEAIRRVEADDIVEIIPDGSTTTKAQDITDIQAGNLTADSWDILEANVTVLNSDAAFVSGRSVIKGGKVKGPSGQTMDISGEYRWIDTFARRDGQWKLVASAAVKVQHPAASPSVSPSASPARKASPATKPSPAAKASPMMKESPVMKASPTVKASPRPTPAKTP